MCGICGVLDFSGGPREPGVIDAMTDSMSHRGPDDRGVWADGPVQLGHRRLSIIDLSAAGHQPMISDDGDAVLVYNGEVYNFPEIAAELRAAGHRFRGHSDSEVVLHAFLEWGPSCFARFNGMFALAIWQQRERRLTLARDRFGIKPLHYHRSGDLFVFGSEIKAILAHPLIQAEMSWPFLHEYLYYGNSLDRESAFHGIHRLPPGTWMQVDPRGVREDRFWELCALEETAGALGDLTEGVRDRLDRAVARHLIADVPVGVFLSGGIDSSAVATFAARQLGDRLRTFTAGFEGGSEQGDERPQARRLAEALGTQHEELYVRTGDLREVLEALVGAHDEPFADAANIPLFLLCRELHDHGVKVVLQGDGGDEVFAGYRRYAVLRHERLWRALASPGLALTAVLPDRPERQRLRRFLRIFTDPDPAVRRALLLTMEDRASPPTRILSEAAAEVVGAVDPFRAYRDVAQELAGLGDPVQAMLYTDFRLLLPDTFLPKVDRSTMAHGIEVRVPFLDTELTDYVLPMPSHMKVRGLQKKFLLRRALRGVVPDEILDGAKRGLDVPYSRWLRTDLSEFARSVLLDRESASSGLFDPVRLEQCISDHVAGVRDNGFLLYKLLQLCMWRNRYLSSSPS